ncbi:hypothetical protein ABZ078_20755 [Streptomyces sp. NPDC006385]|uniref:hypothetical protein n=1 Tax=Streptomyces sp. NPDC006385 TaxID=3156761 RepID=UPI0033B7DCE6
MSEPSAELSCYTAGLVAYLEPQVPDIRDRLAAAVRLRVRTDPPDGGLAFSHHARVDIDGRGRGLVHRGADDWAAARAALDAELARHGAVLAVGNTRHIPWSPSYGGAQTSHWVVLRRHGDATWHVRDDFDALTPHGTQTAYEGLLDDAELQALLTPLSSTTAQAVSRDRHALGEAAELAPYTGYRWLELGDTPDRSTPEGTWVDGPLPALRLVADTVCADPDALTRYADDIWTAARHQRFRLASRPEAAGVAAAAAAWGSLPQAVRFGIASAERGRYREGVVRQAFEQLIGTVERLESEQREETGR